MVEFASIGAGVSDIFAGFADETKAAGDVLEGQAYGKAAQLAFQNEQYTKMSTDIQEAQAQRELLLSQGRTTAEVAGAGFAASGSALDISPLLGGAGIAAESSYRSTRPHYRGRLCRAGAVIRADGEWGAGAAAVAGIPSPSPAAAFPIVLNQPRLMGCCNLSMIDLLTVAAYANLVETSAWRTRRWRSNISQSVVQQFEQSRMPVSLGRVFADGDMAIY